MNSEILQARLQELQQKIGHLLEKHKQQQSIVQQLQQENTKLAQKMRHNTSNTPTLTQNTSNLDIPSMRYHLKDWEAKIDHYISYIDESIAHIEYLYNDGRTRSKDKNM